MDTERLNKLTDKLKRALVKELRDDYPIIEKPAPTTAVLRMAITNVKASKKKARWYNYTPVGAISYGTQRATGAIDLCRV